MATRISDQQFIECWTRHQSPALVAKELNLALSNVFRRRNSLETKYGTPLPTREENGPKRTGSTNMARKRIEKTAESRFTHLENEMQETIEDGVVVVFSDAHYWPGEPSAAHLALLAVCKKLKPDIVVANGDVFDGARISRHPRMGWESRPAVADEVEVVCLRMKEIEKAAPKATLIRTLGNHDSRFENYIAANAPELEGIHGTSLFDFLPRTLFPYTTLFRSRKSVV